MYYLTIIGKIVKYFLSTSDIDGIDLYVVSIEIYI